MTERFKLRMRRELLGPDEFPYSSDREYFESKEFQRLPTNDILEMYRRYFSESIYYINDPLNPESDEEARRVAIQCLIDGSPRKNGYENLPPDVAA